MKALLAFTLLPWAVFATPIQILSGTITVPVNFNLLVPLTVNLTTSTGSITSAGGLNSADNYDTMFGLPATFTPSFSCCGGSAQILDNGSSYLFLADNPGDGPYYNDQGSGVVSSPSVTLTATGPTASVVFPFTAQFEFDIYDNDVGLSRGQEHIFQYTGAGTAVLQYQQIYSNLYMFAGATYTFTPEPSTGAALLIGSAVLAWLAKRRHSSAGPLNRPKAGFRDQVGCASLCANGRKV